jgi:transcription antitermination factor NusG
MSYWAVARLQPQREGLALNYLKLNGYEVYYPRVRERRIVYGRRVIVKQPLFPGYCFVAIELQWHTARWAPGTLGLIMNGEGPAPVSNKIISAIRRREIDGLIDLPRAELRRGARVRILRGPFAGELAIFADMKPHERVEVLLRVLGKVTLAKRDVEVV